MPGKRKPVIRRTISGQWLAASRAVAALAPLPIASLTRFPRSAAVWTLAAKWVVEAVARQQLVPYLEPHEDGESCSARWRVAPVRVEDRVRIAGLAGAMPGVARACPPDGWERVFTPTAALHRFMDAAADGLMRAATEATAPMPANGLGPAWIGRLGRALAGPDNTFVLHGLAERHLPQAIEQWIRPTVSAVSGRRPVVGFRLEEPAEPDGPWRVSYHLHSASGEHRVSVAELASGAAEDLGDGNRFVEPEETLLEALGRCTRIFAPIERSLSHALPYGVVTNAEEAWQFLTRASLHLERAGYHVEVPAALSRVGRRRVRARMRLGVREGAGRGGASGGPSLLGRKIKFRWEASLGDETLTAAEFLRLARAKAPLVLHRGRWVAVDPEEVARLEALIEAGDGSMDAAAALRLALSGEVEIPDVAGAKADVVSEGSVARALELLSEGIDGRLAEAEPPANLAGTLRPYQRRGFAWMQMVTSVGFGVCLADDMGLGKTIQALAVMLEICGEQAGARFLVVCPTSVLGNWRREALRFAPALRVLIHHGPSRAGTLARLEEKLDGDDADRGALLLTSYALARGDRELLAGRTFDLVILDEAQNIKNPDAAQSRAVRELSAHRRAALTGTPVENRLTELWSIMDFLNPGLLGSRAGFKRSFAVPVERYGDDEAAGMLRRVTAPFVMRRMKTDPTIAPELPEKDENVRYCPLTREQAALYQATIDAEMEAIAEAEENIERRGRVLAMLTKLKQICNHPAQFLQDGRPDPRRSGKMTRFLELIEEMVASQDQALVFTQYREMGDLLVDALSGQLHRTIPFLHGGVSRAGRERMVAAFQDGGGPPVMVISLRAGGTGLNLTRANHVFHYDRWWNPAVEDQATDRAFRIGQRRDVTVHRMVVQGTLEEQIDQLLEEKRNLADRVIGAGETWLSELDDAALREIVALGQDAVLEEEP